VKDAAQETANKRKRRPRLLPGLAVKDGFMRHPFDLQFGVRTSGLIAGRNLKSGNRDDRYNTAYYGIAPSVFKEMMARWRRSRPAGPIDAFTFVDLGAGMGRAMLLAAEFPFRAVVGVEMNPTLARIGRRNMALWRKTGRALAPMRMVCRNATEFDPPAGPCVAFLFNSFAAPVLRRLLTAWSRSAAGREGQLDILYVNNEQERVLERQAGFAQLFKGQVKRSRADAVADLRILNHQPDGEYAVTGWEECSIYRWVGKAGIRDQGSGIRSQGSGVRGQGLGHRQRRLTKAGGAEKLVGQKKTEGPKRQDRQEEIF
jgi:SAM-dependent methyltransferase